MVEKLLKHAKRYGSEGVTDVAIEMGATETQLVELLNGLDKLYPPRKGSRPKTPEQRAQILLGISQEEA